MISAGPDRSSCGARRTATASTSATLLVWALAGADRLLPAEVAAAHPLRAVAGAATLASAVTLAPVAVRVLAHPRGAGMPARARAAAVLGLKATLGCLVIAQLATAGARLGALSSGGPAGTVGARVLVLALAGLAAVATTVAAAQLRALCTQGGAVEARTAPHGLPARPDLLDDLALLSARALPGSPAARALAWLTRGLDRWPWSPRRRPARIILQRPASTRPVHPQPE